MQQFLTNSVYVKRPPLFTAVVNQKWFSVYPVLLFHNIMFTLGLLVSASVQRFHTLSLCIKP